MKDRRLTSDPWISINLRLSRRPSLLLLRPSNSFLLKRPIGLTLGYRIFTTWKPQVFTSCDFSMDLIRFDIHGGESSPLTIETHYRGRFRTNRNFFQRHHVFCDWSLLSYAPISIAFSSSSLSIENFRHKLMNLTSYSLVIYQVFFFSRSLYSSSNLHNCLFAKISCRFVL